MESSDMMKVSQDSFAQFAASGEFMFDTQRCDFTELQLQLDKAEDKKLQKFDFQQLIQTMEDVDEFPDTFKGFLKSCLDSNRDAQMISIVLNSTVKAVLQTIPGLYQQTLEKALFLMVELKPEVLALSCDVLLDQELEYYWIVHPL